MATTDLTNTTPTLIYDPASLNLVPGTYSITITSVSKDGVESLATAPITYTAKAKLSTPTIELDGTTLNIYDEEGLATSYDILVDGVVKDSVSAVKLISFTIDGTTYQAEEGMNFYTWANSSYNTGGFACSSTSSNVTKGSQYVKYNGENVSSATTIVSGRAYVLGSSGAGLE